MTQEIVIERLENGKFKPILATYQLGKNDSLTNGILPYPRIRPFISVQIESVIGSPMTCVLTIGNPPMSFLQNIVNSVFRIHIGYGALRNGKFMVKMYPIFIGAVFQNPTIQDGGMGTDQIMIIPLSAYNFSSSAKPSLFNPTQKVGDVMTALFPSPATITYSPKDLKLKNLTQQFTFNNGMTDREIQSHFLSVENIDIRKQSNGNIVVTDMAGIKNVATKSSAEKAVYIYNQPVSKKGINGVPNFRINSDRSVNSKTEYYPRANTFLKSKYAVVGIGGDLNIDLAFVVPEVLSNMYIVIENVGTNINIFHASKNVKDQPTMVFIVNSQLVVFSTWGDSTHQLKLMWQENASAKQEKW